MLLMHIQAVTTSRCEKHVMDIPSLIKRMLEKSTSATDSTHLIKKFYA